MPLTIDDFIAGWIGGMCGLIVGHPLDTLKVRQQTYATNLFHSARRTYKHEGLRGFYKGMLFPLVAVGPSNAVFFGIYGNAMKFLEHSEKAGHKISYRDSKAMGHVFTAGCFAGFFQALFMCPVEVIKTVLQARTEGKGHWRQHYEVPYTGSIDAFKGILRDRGIKGFYVGCAPMMIRDVPTSGIYTLTYEMLLYSLFSNWETNLIVKQMLAGGTAGVLSWIPALPIDVVKTHTQSANPNNPICRSVVICFTTLYKQGGISIFFRGLVPLTMSGFVRNAVTFVGFEAVERYLHRPT